MIAHKDERILMQTVTPPVSLCCLENAPAELAGSPLGTWFHSCSALAGLSRGREGQVTHRKQDEHQKNHRQAKFWSNF